GSTYQELHRFLGRFLLRHLRLNWHYREYDSQTHFADEWFARLRCQFLIKDDRQRLLQKEFVNKKLLLKQGSSSKVQNPKYKPQPQVSGFAVLYLKQKIRHFSHLQYYNK